MTMGGAVKKIPLQDLKHSSKAPSINWLALNSCNLSLAPPKFHKCETSWASSGSATVALTLYPLAKSYPIICEAIYFEPEVTATIGPWYLYFFFGFFGYSVF